MAQTKEHTVYTQPDCPVCKMQKKFINGKVDGYSIILDKGAPKIKKAWSNNTDEAILITNNSLNQLSKSCKEGTIDKESCEEAEFIINEKRKELEFIAKPENKFDEIRRRFKTKTLTDEGFKHVPTAVESSCPANTSGKKSKSGKCVKSGLLEPLQMLLHDAISNNDTESIERIKKFEIEREEEKVKFLEKHNPKEAKKLKRMLELKFVEEDIDNWFV